MGGDKKTGNKVISPRPRKKSGGHEEEKKPKVFFNFLGKNGNPKSWMKIGFNFYFRLGQRR